MSVTPFTTAEQDAIEATVESTMQDTCLVGAPAEEQGDLGALVTTYADGPATPCRFRILNMAGTAYRSGADFTLVTVEAEARLPRTTAVDRRARITITHRFGRALEEPLVYTLAGPPVVNLGSLLLQLVDADL